MFFRALLLTLGVFACATAVIMIKAGTVAPVPLAGYRLLVAAAVLAPLFARDLKRHRNRYTRRHLLRTLLPAVLLATHFISWIFAARLTLAANANLVVNLVPVVMPFLLYLLVRERLTRGELVGTMVAMLGVTFLAGGDYHISREYFLGDVVAFGSMILFAGYLALGRRNRDFPTIWLYVVPVYLFGGLLCVAAAVVSRRDMSVPSDWDWLMVAGLGVVPTVVGHSILNYSMKHIRGQAVSVANLGEFIFAGIMAAAWLGERPGWNFYIACVLTVGGAVWALKAQPRPGAAKPEQLLEGDAT